MLPLGHVAVCNTMTCVTHAAEPTWLEEDTEGGLALCAGMETESGAFASCCSL